MTTAEAPDDRIAPRRADVVLRSLTQVVLWLFAHYALEWLFHATKSSVVSASPIGDRLLMLFAAPLEFFGILLAAQLVLSAVDALRRNATAYPIAALLPTALVTVLAVVAVDNFTKTVFGVGIINTRGFAVGVYAAIVAVFFFWTLQSRAIELAQRRDYRPPAIAAALLVVLAAGAYALLGFRVPTRHHNAGAASAQSNHRAPNVLLVGIDGITVRQTSAYGHPRITTPNLDRLAGRGMLFENAFSNSGRTYGSLASILTGKPPTETHVFFPPSYLDGRHAVEHLPGLLRAAGYTTAQIGMRHYADAEEWNLRGGFDVVNGRVIIGRLTADLSAGGERLRRFRRLINDRVTERFLHLARIRPMEDEYAFLVKGQRSPYFADERRLELARNFIESRRQPWLLHVHLLDSHCCPEAAAHDAAAEEALYEKMLRDTDRSLGRLIETVRATGQLDHTLIIVYSDHDRSWGTLERLPLVIALPRTTAPRRVRPNVQLLDLAPTILEAAGLPKPAWMRGQSLLQPERLDPRRPLFSINRIAERKAAGPRMSRLVDAGPPLYGARTAGIVVCDTWVEVRLPDGKARAGRVAGHTQPCGESLADQAHDLLVAHLREHGYPVGGAAVE